VPGRCSRVFQFVRCVVLQRTGMRYVLQGPQAAVGGDEAMLRFHAIPLVSSGGCNVGQEHAALD